MAHYAICKVCGLRFDRDKEPFVAVGARRYAHKSCYEAAQAAIPQDEKDYNELEKYIKKLFKIDTLNIKIRKQIKEYKETYNYTYTGIQKTLYWWYEIKKNSISQSNDGLGIVPYVYNDACKYFYSIFLAKLVNDEKGVVETKIEEIEIASPRVRIAPTKLFDLDGKE